MKQYLLTSYAYAVPPVLGVLVFLSLSVVALFRGRKNSTNILFAGLCFLGAVINADIAALSFIPDRGFALKVDRFTYFFFVFSLPVFIQFVHSFLGIKKRMWLEYLAYFSSLVILFFSQSSFFIMGVRTYSFGMVAVAGPVYYVFAILCGLTELYCLTILFLALGQARENVQKNRIKYILGGFGGCTFLVMLNLLPIMGYDVYMPGNFGFVPILFLAYGVLKYDLLDIGAVIRCGAIYFIFTALLTLFSIVIIFFFNHVFVAANKTILLPFVLSIVMVLIFNPVQSAVQRLINNLFFRGRYDYQQLLKQVSGEMASLFKTYQIRELILRSVSSALHVSPVCLALYLEDRARFYLYTYDKRGDIDERALFDRTHPLVDVIERSRAPLNRIAAERLGLPQEEHEQILRVFNEKALTTIIPMLSGKRLVGMICLGEKKSGELFVHEDMELLTTIANQSIIAIDNAHTYERLEKLNQDLEQLVAQRTASLRKTLEEKEKTQAQLVQSESLAAIGQLVAGAAHELNNPLASASSLIQSSLETLMSKGSADDELVDDLKFSLKELKRMGEIVRSLLDLSRKTQIYEEPVLIHVAIDDALRILYNQYKNLRVEIEKNYDETLPVVEGNFANLGQVFINVLKNAIQALPNGIGRITLTTRYDENRDLVVIECHDTGKGIARDHLKDVFKPFFTTKGVGEGTGLGLYVSHEIIKRHGGTIEMRSEEGRGTTVVIALPAKGGAREQPDRSR